MRWLTFLAMSMALMYGVNAHAGCKYGGGWTDCVYGDLWAGYCNEAIWCPKNNCGCGSKYGGALLNRNSGLLGRNQCGGILNGCAASAGNCGCSDNACTADACTANACTDDAHSYDAEQPNSPGMEVYEEPAAAPADVDSAHATVPVEEATLQPAPRKSATAASLLRGLFD